MSLRTSSERTSEPPRLWTWLEGGSIAAAHAVASVFAFGCLVAVPLGLFTCIFLAGIAYAIATNGDLGGPLFYPLGVLVLLALGSLSAAAVCGLGIATDLARRWLRWPLWTPFAGVTLAGLAVLPAAALLSGSSSLRALAFGALGAAAFATYWVPLALSEGARRLLLGGLRWLGARVAKRAQRDSVEDASGA